MAKDYVGQTRSDQRGKGYNFFCTVCDFDAKDRRDVARHVEAKHLNLRYQCQLCPKVLKTQRSLQIHIRNRHQQKKYEKYN